MYVLLTTLVSIASTFTGYIQDYGYHVANNITVEGANLLSFGLPRSSRGSSTLSSGWARAGGLQVGCVTLGKELDPDKYSTEVLHQYLDLSQRGLTLQAWQYNLSPASCVIRDSTAGLVMVLADSVGAIPVWYYLSSTSRASEDFIVVTTDLFGGLNVHIDIAKYSVVSPGVLMGLDLRNGHEIVFMRHWTSLSQNGRSIGGRSSNAELKPLPFAFRLLSQIYSALHERGNNTLIELDLSQPSSRIVSCAMRGIGIDHVTYVTRPLVAEYSDPLHPIVAKIFNSIPTTAERSRSNFFEYLPEERVCLRRIINERFELVSAALPARPGPPPSRLLIFDMGNPASILRPYQVYVQSYIAALMGVEITALFGELKIFNLVSPSIVNSALQQAIEVLEHESAVCGDSSFQMAWQVGTKSLDLRRRPVLHWFGSEGRLGARDSSTVETVYRPSSPSPVGDLWLAASQHASGDHHRDIVVLLVTSGYASMLRNFLRHVKNARATVTGDHSGMLVITPRHDESIIELTRSSGIGLFSGQLSSESRFQCQMSKNKPQNESATADESFDFGTICYQQLILTRTRAVMYLLLLGFSPLVSDIDTVWRDDALRRIHEMFTFPEVESTRKAGDVDLVATLDGEEPEICGCFLYLSPSPSTIEFWSQITDFHSHQVGTATAKGALENVFDSEQKILTRMLLHGGYEGSALVGRLLSRDMFPSGYDYFNLWRDAEKRDSGNVVVVHNNFVVGDLIKVMRFKMHNMWYLGNDSSYELIHSAVNRTWSKVFENVVFKGPPPTLVQYVPIHNSVVDNTTKLLFLQLAMENFKIDYKANLCFEMNPPRSLDWSTFFANELHFQHSSRRDFTFSMRASLLAQQEVSGPLSVEGVFQENPFIFERGVFSDVAVGRNYFALDRDGRFHSEADRNVFSINRFSDEAEIGFSTPVFPEVVENSERSSFLVILIKVLAYTRHQSLKRLLQSLEKADYMDHGRMGLVDLEILVDGPRFSARNLRGVLEREEINCTIAVAEEFVWPHGQKKVTKRSRNIGLIGQWYRAWQPESSRHACFIFEDDLEVSKYYYRYSYFALEKYYCGQAGGCPGVHSGGTSTALQLRAHIDLLNSVRLERGLPNEEAYTRNITEFVQNDNLIFASHLTGSCNTTSKHRTDCDADDNEDNDTVPALRRYAKRYAGIPIMNGVCIHNQRGDVVRYGADLEIRNNKKQFLYSLISSWGPVLLPLPWRAFLEWWRNRCPEIVSLSDDSDELGYDQEKHSEFYDLQKELFSTLYETHSKNNSVEGIIINDFWRANPGIWTPWMSRFVFETGMKCLHNNPTDDVPVFLGNHREIGENYKTQMGFSGQLINSTGLLLGYLFERGGQGYDPTSVDVEYSDSISDQVSFFSFKEIAGLELNDSTLDNEYVISPFLSICNLARRSRRANHVFGARFVDYGSCSDYCSAVFGAVNTRPNISSSNIGEYLFIEMESSLHSDSLSDCIRGSLVDIKELSRWQFDYNIRRAGASYMPDALQAFNEDAFKPKLDTEIYETLKLNCSGTNILSTIHWGSIMHMLESHIDRDAPTIHVGCSYLIGASLNMESSEVPFLLNHGLFLGGDSSVHIFRCLQNLKDKEAHSRECPFVSTLPPTAATNKREPSLLDWINNTELVVVVLTSEFERDKAILSLMNNVEVVLVLAMQNSVVSCVAAPMKFDIKSSTQGCNDSPASFVLVETICSLESDRGALLYKRAYLTSKRRKAGLKIEEKYATMRRFPGNLMSRRIFY